MAPYKQSQTKFGSNQSPQQSATRIKMCTHGIATAMRVHILTNNIIIGVGSTLKNKGNKLASFELLEGSDDLTHQQC